MVGYKECTGNHEKTLNKTWSREAHGTTTPIACDSPRVCVAVSFLGGAVGMSRSLLNTPMV